MRRRLRVGLVLAFVLGPASVARAAVPDPAAESLFNEGRALLDEGKVAEACQRFERSQRLDPAVGTLLNLGDCYERRNALANAWVTYRQAAALATTRHDEARARVAQDEAARLEPRLAHLELTVDAPAPDEAVTRDGAIVDPAVYGVSVPIDPGAHVFEASAPGRLAWSRRVTFVEGEHTSLRVPRLDRDPNARAPAAIAPPESDPRGADTQRTIALGLEIGGGAVLVAGLAFGGLAMAKWNSVDAVCPNGECSNAEDQRRLSPDVDAARTFATLGTIGTAVGAAVLVTGVVLHLTAPRRSVAIAPVVDEHAVGIATRFSM